ncbi:MAG TPA: glycosyltransferase family 4 protein [Abditibacteriaceae bacterium]|nr:glycosyltransferase family 4 protein [Abditibacteriaceae bacterium]
MNIAFFCDAYKPTRNGVAVSVATTAEELRRRGHRVTIFAPRYKGYRDADRDVIRFPAGHWFRAKDFPVAWPLLVRLSPRSRIIFWKRRFDVVHSHSPFTIGGLGAQWAQPMGIPIVFTFHTLYHRYLHYAPLPPGVARSYTLWRVLRYCQSCDHIIAPSTPIARIVRRLCPQTPCTVVRTGIHVNRFAGGDGGVVRARYKISPDDIVLLYVGRLAWEKNLDFLMRSVAPLLRDSTGQGSTASTGGQLPQVRLLLVGGGPALDDLQDLARQLGTAPYVTFTGFIDPAAIAEYYAAGDIFTFASRTETQGVSIAEALAAALPCVVVGAMGAAEAVTDGMDGFVVPPDAARFRQAVWRLIEDAGLRAAMAANARIKAPSLSLEHSVDKLLELYSTLPSPTSRYKPG